MEHIWDFSLNNFASKVNGKGKQRTKLLSKDCISTEEKFIDSSSVSEITNEVDRLTTVVDGHYPSIKVTTLLSDSVGDAQFVHDGVSF